MGVIVPKLATVAQVVVGALEEGLLPHDLGLWMEMGLELNNNCTERGRRGRMETGL